MRPELAQPFNLVSSNAGRIVRKRHGPTDVDLNARFTCVVMWGRPSGLLASPICRAEPCPHVTDAVTNTREHRT